MQFDVVRHFVYMMIAKNLGFLCPVFTYVQIEGWLSIPQ